MDRRRNRAGSRCALSHQPRRARPELAQHPVITVAEPGREFAFTRTEKYAGTIQWRYLFTPDGTGTVVTESYEVTRPVTRFGWFVIGVLYGNTDRRADLHRGMTQTLQRLATLTETPQRTPAKSQPARKPHLTSRRRRQRRPSASLRASCFIPN